MGRGNIRRYLRLSLRARFARVKTLDRQGCWKCRFCREHKTCPAFLSNWGSYLIIRMNQIQKSPNALCIKRELCGIGQRDYSALPAPLPSGSLCSCKNAPGVFVELGFLSNHPYEPNTKKPQRLVGVLQYHRTQQRDCITLPCAMSFGFAALTQKRSTDRDVGNAGFAGSIKPVRRFCRTGVLI